MSNFRECFEFPPSCTDNDVYPTHMDGVDGWACDSWTGCQGGAELVHCTGDYYHQVKHMRFID